MMLVFNEHHDISPHPLAPSPTQGKGNWGTYFLNYYRFSLLSLNNTDGIMAKMRGREEYPIYFGAQPELLKIASDLRNNMTSAEKVLWKSLCNRQLNGYRFRRQHPVFEFVADFFCYEAMLAIEVDGEVHNASFQQERDTERTKILNSLGIKELRFRNTEVLGDTANVLKKIEFELRQSQ